jgi:hypothetical protein
MDGKPGKLMNAGASGAAPLMAVLILLLFVILELLPRIAG